MCYLLQKTKNASCKSLLTSLSYDLYSTLDNQKALKTLARPLHSKLTKIQGLFNTVRTLKKCAACKSFCFAYYTCCLFDFLVFFVVVVALSLLPHKRNNIVDIADMRQSCLKTSNDSMEVPWYPYTGAQNLRSNLFFLSVVIRSQPVQCFACFGPCTVLQCIFSLGILIHRT